MSNDVVINVKVKNDVNFNPIRDSLKGIETAASQAGQALASGLGDAASSTEKLTTGLAGSAAQAGVTEAASTEASGGLNLLGDALLAVAGAIPMVLGGFAALAPALLAAGGAAGAAMTGIAGLGIALATLKIGFGGIGAALQAHGKAMGGAGKAASDTAEQEYQAAKRIKDATRAVKDAQQSVVDATKDVVDAKAREKEAAADVNQAREDEIDRIRELDLALRGQKISQAEAAQALIEAKEKAKRANEAGSDWEKAEAKNAVDRAQLQYDETTEKLGDLTKEKQKSDKQGVEGSDQVQAALKRQTDAHQGVLDAQERLTKANEALVRSQENLADAHHKVATAAAGGAAGMDAFGDAMRKLSPNAQKLVYALLDIEKRFDAIKRRVQDRLLAGFDTAVTDLADKWLPHLDDILGNMADHLNHFGKQLMKSLGDSEFIRNIERAGREMGKFIDKISDATGSLIDAFGRLAGHSGPVLQVIGDLIKNIFDKFDAWIKAADNSGALDNFMTMAAQTLQKIFDIGGSVIEVIGQFVAIIFPSSKKAGDSVLDGVQRALDSISKWLKDPKNQKEIKSIADALAAVVGFVVKASLPRAAARHRVVGTAVSEEHPIRMGQPVEGRKSCVRLGCVARFVFLQLDEPCRRYGQPQPLRHVVRAEVRLPRCGELDHRPMEQPLFHHRRWILPRHDPAVRHAGHAEHPLPGIRWHIGQRMGRGRRARPGTDPDAAGLHGHPARHIRADAHWWRRWRAYHARLRLQLR
jgi:hypothetical protein